MVFSQGNQKVQAFPPQRADEPLAERIGLRTLRRRFEHPESQVAYALVELLREDAVAVMDEEAVGMVRWNRFAQLLQRPRGRGMRRHIGMEDAAGGMFHDHKHVEEAKGRRDHDTEVTRHDRLGMIAHKGLPALGRHAFPSPRVQALRHILAHGAW